MLAVIEGPDGSGKSTLIQQLRRNSTRYFVMVRSGAHPPSHEAMEQYIEGTSLLEDSIFPSPLICDRFQPISEAVYKPLIRHQPFLENWPDYLHSVDTVIYCRPQTEVIMGNLHREEQMKGVPEQIHRIIQRYDEVMTAIGNFTYVFHYDYLVHTVDAVADRIWRAPRFKESPRG